MFLHKILRAGAVALVVVLSAVGSQNAALAAPAGTAAPRSTAAAPRSTADAPRPAAAAPRPAKDVETRITASKLTYSADKQQAVFEGNVHVQRPDFQLWADKLTVHLKPAAPKDPAAPKGSIPDSMGGGDLDKLVADRNVRMSAEGGRTGTCAKATYTASDGVLHMEGDPRVSDNENTITGEEILYYTQQNRSEVRGGKKRVEAVFSSPAKTPQESRSGGR